MALKRATHTQPSTTVSAGGRVGGRGVCVEVWAVRLDGAASSADLGGSSKYSNENFED